MEAQKHHFIGVGIVLLACVIITIPLVIHMKAYNMKQAEEKFMRHKALTRREFEEILSETRINLERGLYKKTLRQIKSDSGKILHRDFSYEVLIQAGDLFYMTEFITGKQKYEDALFFYMLANEQVKTVDKEYWREFQVANCHTHLGYTMSAVHEFKKYIQDYPESPYIADSWIALAELLIKKKKTNEAQEIFMNLVDTLESKDQLARVVYELAGLFFYRADMLPEAKKIK